jgi:hypothetical protein
MPGFDRSGPMGAGPMTGGGRGFCNPATTPGPRAFFGGYAGGSRFRSGLGRGRGWRRGLGRGYRFYPPVAGFDDPVDTAGELAALRNEADYLKGSLDEVIRRIDELEKKPADES